MQKGQLFRKEREMRGLSKGRLRIDHIRHSLNKRKQHLGVEREVGSWFCLGRAGLLKLLATLNKWLNKPVLDTAEARQVVTKEWILAHEVPVLIQVFEGPLHVVTRQSHPAPWLATGTRTLPKVQPSSILFIPQSSWIFSASLSRIFSRWGGKTT